MNVADNWEDYEIMDMANGEKLERWKDIYLVRPDPQIIWKEKSYPEKWEKANAIYRRSKAGGGGWEYKKRIPESWQVKYYVGAKTDSNTDNYLTFNIKPMGFKHTGLFLDLSVNWDWMINKITEANKVCTKPISVLNLFAYTGGATVACLHAGSSVCHVDSSKGMVSWAKENVISSGLQERPVRYIVDDVIKFVSREIKRGNKYDGVIMDPPSYGRGASGEVWQFEENISDLVSLCTQVLSDNPLFFLINSYTTGISGEVLANILRMNLKKYKGNIESGEIGLPMSSSELVLPCGIYGKWENMSK
jgi:23S rRNA (cytosine1962-C5)-methyltransferase